METENNKTFSMLEVTQKKQQKLRRALDSLLDLKAFFPPGHYRIEINKLRHDLWTINSFLETIQT